jgi:phosphatidylethanolamine-binding protein (PEBP) family uncharacterized protein
MERLLPSGSVPIQARTQTNGLLVRLAKAARTGALLPVLALAAALVFAGCGGGDSSSTATTGTTTNSAETDGSAGGAKAGQNAGAASKQGKSNKDQSAQSGGGSSGGKQGSNASQPTGEPEPGITPKQRAKATTANVTLESPSFAGGAVLPVKYTCDGGNESPPLQWSGVPDEASELVLFALNMNPVEEALFFDWAVAGLDPSLEEIKEGKLPSGAVVGKNSFGKQNYSLCPPEAGGSESYIFMLYAIPEALSPEKGFDPLPLREEVLAQSGNVGLLSASYKRH